MSVPQPDRKTSVWRKVAVVGIGVLVLLGLGWLGLHVPLARNGHKKARRASAHVRGLAIALEQYWVDFDCYPPDTVADSTCSPEHQMNETLVFHLGTVFDVGRHKYGPYVEFLARDLTDADDDGFHEFRDPWGGLYLYAQKDWHGKTPTVNDELFDIISPGPDGELGGTMSPAKGYVPATTPEGKRAEADNITADTKVPQRFD